MCWQSGTAAVAAALRHGVGLTQVVLCSRSLYVRAYDFGLWMLFILRGQRTNELQLYYYAWEAPIQIMVLLVYL